MHVHTDFSPDSSEKMERYCKAALEKGVDVICFTEHAGHGPLDKAFNEYDPELFFLEFMRLKKKYQGRLKLLSGIEFDEPHRYPKGLREYDSLFPYDFILGSVHFWGDPPVFPGDMMEKGVTSEKCFREYWPEILASVKTGGFDCVAHLDFPKRYFKELVYQEDIITEIAKEMVKRDIILEVNTSSLRMGLDSMPSEDMLKIYRRCGGKYFTIGSDAHVVQDLFSPIPLARKIPLSLGLKEVYFEKRVRKLV